MPKQLSNARPISSQGGRNCPYPQVSGREQYPSPSLSEAPASSSPSSSGSAPTPRHIPRPRNPWIIYRSEHHDSIRDQIAREKATPADPFPPVQEPEVSARLGPTWKALSPDAKAVYRERARIEKLQHEQKYPDYIYQPNRGKAKAKGGPVKKNPPPALPNLTYATLLAMASASSTTDYPQQQSAPPQVDPVPEVTVSMDAGASSSPPAFTYEDYMVPQEPLEVVAPQPVTVFTTPFGNLFSCDSASPQPLSEFALASMNGVVEPEIHPAPHFYDSYDSQVFNMPHGFSYTDQTASGYGSESSGYMSPSSSSSWSGACDSFYSSGSGQGYWGGQYPQF